jgi:hypothetical protein
VSGEVIVKTVHWRRYGYCLGPVCRRAFARHGLDFRSFVRNGISADVLEATGDAMAVRIARLVRAEVEAATDSAAEAEAQP